MLPDPQTLVLLALGCIGVLACVAVGLSAFALINSKRATSLILDALDQTQPPPIDAPRRDLGRDLL